MRLHIQLNKVSKLGSWVIRSHIQLNQRRSAMAAVLFECKLKKVKEEDDDKCLPEEILFQDILIRLPIKPLLRFKSVCKRWRYLIQSPSFITSHRRHHFRHDSWNKLVQTPYTDSRVIDRQVNYGFGSVDMDYKVVVVLTCRTSAFLAFVYSQRRGTWETLVDYELGKRDLFKPKAVDGIAVRTQGNVLYPRIDPDFMICPQGFFNGCWHWIAWKPDEDYKSIVLTFHMGDEVFKFFGGAPGYVRSRIIHGGMPGSLRISMGSVSVLNHHLAAFYHSFSGRSDSDSIFDVWMMMEYWVEESWTKIYTIQTMCPHLHKLVGIRSSVRDGGIQIEKIIYKDNKEKLISCDDSVVENHGLFDVSSSIYWNTLGFTAYSETLERVSISDEEDDGVPANSG